MVTVSGSFANIRNKLLAISATVKHRKHSGWSPFQSDETWLYITHPEASISGVCPVCGGFEARGEFMGDEIPYDFPTREQIDPLHYVHPRVHQHHTELEGMCHCELMWIDPIGTLRARLEDEIREVI